MSINFSANQYENAFKSDKLQNWQVPKKRGNIISMTGPSRHYSQMPERHQGFSTIHANDRGHLLPRVPRRRESPWGTFVGTWDVPCHFPGNKILDPTARSEDAQMKLKMSNDKAAQIMSGSTKRCKIPSPLPVRIYEESASNEPLIQNTPPMSPSFGKNQMLTAPTLASSHQVEWPKQGGDVEQTIANPGSPKPPTPMNVGGEAVQCEVRQAMSPEAVAMRGATPMGRVGDGQRTPVDNVNWPMAKNATPTKGF